MAEPAQDLNGKAPDRRGFSFVLRQNNDEPDQRLELHARHHPRFGPVFTDWLSAEMYRRVAAGKRQLLARAVGLNKRASLRVLDATGGLGRDAWTLAALGADVTLAERNETLFTLLQDGHRRAVLIEPEIAQRLLLVRADAHVLLQQSWDVVHLDPMFPHAGKTALPQKELQILRELCGDDTDADSLLAPALAAARRVAVKRPLSAPALANRKPRATLKGTQMRYDIYLASP